LKAFCNRFFFQFCVGFLWMASMREADPFGKFLILCGSVLAAVIYKK